MHIEGYKRRDKTPYDKIAVKFIAGIIVGLLIFVLLISVERINNNDMEPNYKIEDIIYAYRYSTPKFGDIVMLNVPNQNDKVTVSRIIASENQTVEIKNKTIFVDGKQISPDWKFNYSDQRIFNENFTTRDNMSPVKIGKEKYFLIGDNYDIAFDSRFFGEVDNSDITGVVLFSF